MCGVRRGRRGGTYGSNKNENAMLGFIIIVVQWTLLHVQLTWPFLYLWAAIIDLYI